MHPFHEEIQSAQLLHGHLMIGGASPEIVERTIRMLRPATHGGQLLDMAKVSQWGTPPAIPAESAMPLGCLLLDAQAWLVAGQLFPSSSPSSPKALLEVIYELLRINAELAKTGQEIRLFPRKTVAGQFELGLATTAIEKQAMSQVDFFDESDLMKYLAKR